MAGCDVVFHLAAKVDGVGPWAEFERDTIKGTENTLLAAAEARVSRFVHCSTEATVAAIGPLRDADETTPYPNPSTAYAYSRSKVL